MFSDIEVQERIRQLRTINKFNFSTPFFYDKEKDANFAVTKALQDIINTYHNELKKKYTFIIKYDKDIYSFLAYRMVRNVGAALQLKMDIRILGDIDTKEEKEIFKDMPTIGWRKARKIKNAVFVTGYHPIYNVIDLSSYSKTFIEILNPIARFEPDTLSVAQTFYLDVKSALWSIFLEGRDDNYLYGDWSNEIDNDIPIVFFKLTGTEADFPVFDLIRKSSNEGNIHLYIVENEEQYNFIRCNLAPYIETRNIPNELNTVTEKEYRHIVACRGLIDEIHYFDIDTLPPDEEEENEDSDC